MASLASTALRALVLLAIVAGAQLAQSAAAPHPGAPASDEPSFGAGADASARSGARLFALETPEPTQLGLAASFVPEARLLVGDALVLHHPRAAPGVVVVRVVAVDGAPGVDATLTFHPEGRAPVALALAPDAWALVPLDAGAGDVHASLAVQAAPGASPPASVLRALLVLGA